MREGPVGGGPLSNNQYNDHTSFSIIEDLGPIWSHAVHDLNGPTIAPIYQRHKVKDAVHIILQNSGVKKRLEDERYGVPKPLLYPV